MTSAEVTLEKRQSWPSLIREAIRGSHQDYTSGPISRSLVLLAVPMVLETAMESLFALVDVFFVSRLGSDAVATVGLTESMMTLVYTLAIGLSIGVTAMVARRIGEKDSEGAARAAVQAIVLGIFVSVAIAAVGIVFAPDLLALMGASESVQAVGSSYTRMMLGGSVTVVLIWLINAVFRGAGDASIAMRTLWLANGINIVLCPTLIFGLGPFPELGLTGAAVATTIGRGIGVMYQVRQLVRRDGRVLIRKADLRIMPGVLNALIKLSGTGTFQVFVATSSYVGVVRVLSTFGSTVLAGYTMAIRLMIFVMLPSWGLSNAAATMVGQALGAKNPDRAEGSVKLAAIYNTFWMGFVCLVFLAFAPQLIGVFTRDPEVARHGVLSLRVMAVGLAFYGYGMVLHQSFNGAGDTWTPTWLNIAFFWMMEIPLAWILSRPWGPLGVYLSIPLAEISLTIASALMFRQGRWKTKSV